MSFHYDTYVLYIMTKKKIFSTFKCCTDANYLLWLYIKGWSDKLIHAIKKEIAKAPTLRWADYSDGLDLR